MQIRRLNPAEDAGELAASLPVAERWRSDFTPGLPVFREARLRLWATDGYQQRATVLGAFADEQSTEPEGIAIFGIELTKNLEAADLTLLVPAAARDRGVHALLLDEARRMTAELGRKRLVVEMPETEDPAAFAQQRGEAKYTDTPIASRLDLSEIDRAQYEAWAAPSAKNSQYTLVRWIGRCPDEYTESYCAALDAMSDAPMGEAQYEWAKNDVERLRFNEEQTEQFGVRRYVQAAVDPDGHVAGFHLLAAYPDEPADINVWDTGVVRAHRGHGLGLRVKAAAALWVLEDRPDTRWMFTFNNSENTWMLAVNRTMGYRPIGDWKGYEFAVTG